MTKLLDRREFIVSTLAAPLLGACAKRETGPQRTGRQLGYALVGLGTLSRGQLGPALQRTTNCRLAGIVTGTPASAAEWQSRYGIPDRSVYTYDTIERMADNPDIDVVYVVTPNSLHADHSIAAIRAGKHVFCEKPMEVSVERCEAMIAAAREAGVQLGIAYRCQFEPHHLECERLAREAVFGKLRTVEAAFGFPMRNADQWRLDRQLSGGGPLMDVGIYALQTARMLAGEPVAVSAVQTNTESGPFRDVESDLTMTLTFPDGVVATCSCSYTAAMNSFTATAEHGSFGMRPAYSYSGNRGWRSDGAELSFPPIDHFVAEMDDFADCIMTGRRTRVPGEEGLRDIRIMMAAYQAARSGQPVRLAAG